MEEGSKEVIKAGVATGVGAGVGAATSAVVGGVGVTALGGAVAVTMAPVAAIGAAVGLAGYAVYRLGKWMGGGFENAASTWRKGKALYCLTLLMEMPGLEARSASTEQSKQKAFGATELRRESEMAFRKPITTLGGLLWWKNIKQDTYFIMQEHRVGLPLWPYKYRITMRENRMEIANSNDPEEITKDWEYLESHVVPQLGNKVDIGQINLVELVTKLIKSL